VAIQLTGPEPTLTFAWPTQNVAIAAKQVRSTRLSIRLFMRVEEFEHPCSRLFERVDEFGRVGNLCFRNRVDPNQLAVHLLSSGNDGFRLIVRPLAFDVGITRQRFVAICRVSTRRENVFKRSLCRRSEQGTVIGFVESVFDGRTVDLIDTEAVFTG
jgi:hypothetical protein